MVGKDHKKAQRDIPDKLFLYQRHEYHSGQTNKPFTPEPLDDPELEERISRIEKIHSKVSNLLSDFSINRYAHIVDGVVYYEPSYKSEGNYYLDTKELPSNWIQTNSGEFVRLYTPFGLLTGNFDPSVLYTAEIEGESIRLYHNWWVDSVAAVLVSKLQLRRKLNFRKSFVLKFAVDCATRAFSTSKDEYRKDLHFEMIELLKSLVLIYPGFEAFISELLKGTSYQKAENISHKIFSEYLATNFPDIHQNYLNLRNRAIEIDKDDRNHFGFEVSLASTIVQLEGPTNKGLLQRPANFSARHGAWYFTEELREKYDFAPFAFPFASGDKVRKQGMRIFMAAQLMEYEWQISHLIEILGMDKHELKSKQDKISGYCPKCGTPRLKDHQYCSSCGHKFE